jgi:prepilin-type processing-associated H-X9-DG protein
MQCPSCRAVVTDNLLQCSHCGGDLSITVLTADGQRYGPYSAQAVGQYVAEQRIPLHAQASMGSGPPAPLHQVLASAGVGLPAPGVPPPAQYGTPGAYPAAPVPPYPTARAPRKKGVSGWVIGGIVAAVVLLPLIVIAAIGVPFAMRAGSQRQTASCQSNLKQLALGMLMYCQDYDEVYPPADDWQDRVYPYVKNESIFVCPKSGLGRESYEYNPVVSARSLMTVQSPATSAMLWDKGFPSGKGPHKGGWNVAFCDGHVKLVLASGGAQYQTSF